jgi:VCBS repeat-containing protein
MFDTAFDDEHKQQGLAMKLLADRLMPLAGFTADGKTNAQVSINITGLNDGDGSVVIDGNTGTVENDDEV